MFQRRGAYAILIGVVLLVWQFYVVKQTRIAENINEIESLSIKVQQYLNSIANEGKYENETTVSVQNPLVLQTTLEPYKVMETYEQERQPEVDTPFKRILFWNDVIEKT